MRKGENRQKLFAGKYRIESIRLKGFDYSSPGSYFVTMNIKNRICWFGDVGGGRMNLSEIGRIIDDEWRLTPAIRPIVTIDAYQIMPDHFHGIVIIHESDSSARTGIIPFVDWDKAMVVPGQKSVKKYNHHHHHVDPVETDGRIGNRSGNPEEINPVEMDGRIGNRSGNPEEINPVETDGCPSPREKKPSPNKFGPQSNNLASIIRGFKSAGTNRIHTAGHHMFQWQSLYWDRIIRNEDELDRIRAYTRENPHRWNDSGRQNKRCEKKLPD